MTIANNPHESTLPRAKAALAELSRLQDFGRDLKSRLATAEKALTEATAARVHADMQAILAPKTEQAAWKTRADAAAKTADDTQREVARLTGAVDHLPVLLAAADDEIMAAHEAFERERAGRASKARADLAAQIRNVCVRLGQLLQQGHALGAAGIAIGPFLNETNVPNPIAVLPFLQLHGLRLNDVVVDLRSAWRSDAAAVALYETHLPYHTINQQFRAHIVRIRDSRERALNAANLAARSQPHDRTPVISYRETAPADPTPGVSRVAPGP